MIQLQVNGESRAIEATKLAQALLELGYHEAHVATALNGVFVPAGQRGAQALRDGDALEVLAPMQGG
ncbi:sulfur carrier protein ThiS [Thermomonas fusca]